MQDVERILRITANVADGKIINEEGEHSFFFGDNNKIIVTLEDVTEQMYVSISANVLVDTYISELTYNQETNEYLLDAEDFNTILSQVSDKIRLNVHISNLDGKRITTLSNVTIESKLGFDNEATIVTPKEAKTLEDFYIALEITKNIDVEKINEAINKIEKLDQEIDNAKTIETELKETVENINTKLKNGEFDGPAGYTPVKGKDYFTEEEVQEVQACIETNIIGNLASVLDSINGEVI